MHLGIYISKAAFENGRDWPWPSRSFCTLTDKRAPKCPCHHDKLTPPVSARISKFAPIVHLGTSKAAFENGRDWSWPSRSFWTSTDKHAPKCLRDNSWPVSTRITKFAPIVHLMISKAAFENGRDWPWPSRSFWTLTDKRAPKCLCLRNNTFTQC